MFKSAVPGSRRWLMLAVLLFAAGGGSRGHLFTRPVIAAPARAARLPALGPARRLKPGIQVHEVKVMGRVQPIKLWIYLPERTPVGKKLPCVLIAPAGSRLFHGMTLGEGDRPEHLPYVKAGFAVVAYDIEGAVSPAAQGPELVKAAGVFRRAEAGLSDTRKALDYALARVPAIDPKRIYTAGHSSAGTLSLLVAQHEPRIAACIAYAPVCDVLGRLGSKFLRTADRDLPGYGRFLWDHSPSTNVELLRCPLFLFHADDDANVTTAELDTFTRRVQQSNRRVNFARVPTGNHYDSMIQQGIPQAIQWLKGL